MEALFLSMATSSGNNVLGLPLEISWLVERVRKCSFYNNFFFVGLIAKPESAELRQPPSMTTSQPHQRYGSS